MSKKLFERLNNMSVDEIINEDFEGKDDVIEENVGRPCSIEEANNYFFQDGELTLDEMNILMENKLKELWDNESNSST